MREGERGVGRENEMKSGENIEKRKGKGKREN